LKIHDTCGINNLRGMPAVMGCFCSMIAGTILNSPDFSAGYQAFGLICTMLCAIIGGGLTGCILRFVIGREHGLEDFEDNGYWKKN